MTEKQFDTGQALILQVVQRVAATMGLQVTDPSWGTAASGRPALAVYITGKRQLREFAEEDLEDMPGDASIRVKVEQEITSWLSSIVGPEKRIGF